ncbi:restriction endonuclease S subunit [Malaciobacter marinus]|jgi:type I restriction enzyme S subunit|uniref:Restriction endonuclease S subunit n=1 Tax=Malaciobacter marinus TaxID=505249 RepID=A0AB36ZZ02_9BACT|nr:restriction endonuclease subunit S [Malaciobacter marinus]PPK61824.1 restriction endonuclease S subunit [Malaciobacter marinus]
MAGTLDSQVIEKFKEFQHRTKKYLDLDIEKVLFDKKTINEIVGDFIKGSTPKYSSRSTNTIVIKSGQARGNYNVFDFKNTAYLDLAKVKNPKYLQKGDILINTTGVGTAGRVTLFDLSGSYVSDSHITALRYDLNSFDKFYLLYFFVNYSFKKLEAMAEGSGGQVELRMDKIKPLVIPIPKDYNEKYKSIDIQKAIVEFLEFWKINYTDIFRQTVAHQKPILEKIKRALISATLKYDKTIVNSFNEYAKTKGIYINLSQVEFQEKNIDKIVDISRGKVISKKDLKQNGQYPVYSSQTKNEGLFGFIDSYMHDGDAITWTTDGKHAGTTFLRSGKFNYTNVCGLMTIKKEQDVNIHYLSYMTNLIFPKYVDRTSQNSKLMTHHLDDITIPIPYNSKVDSFEIQKALVEFWEMILNNIDKRFVKFDNIERLTDKIDEAFLYRTFSKIVWREE